MVQSATSYTGLPLEKKLRTSKIYKFKDILRTNSRQHTYSVSQKKSLLRTWQFFQNGWEFFNHILHAYYAFLSTLDYDF